MNRTRMSSLCPHYTAPPKSVFSYCWDGECAVYHVGSGDTHLLSQVDVDVLERINGKPMSAKALSLEFEQRFDGGATQYIQTLLCSLVDLGLIEVLDIESAH